MFSLIRILLQRLLIVIFGILAFFGINPDISIPTIAVIEERKEVQQERVDEVFSDKNQVPIEVKPKNEKITEVEDKITEIQKTFTENITLPLTEKAKDIIPASLVYDDKESVFNIRDVVVNIMCIEKTSSFTRLSSGSGVIISPNGVVLTNAHVTYPFLQSSQFGSSIYSCSIRRENIPNYGYNAELVYYPNDWLVVNQEVIKDPLPVGTGENDYALLQITSPLGPTPKASAFPYATTEIKTSNLKKDTSISVAGYPSSNSGVFELDTKPGLKIAQTQIDDFFTFGTQSFDVLKTGVNEVAHRGASGGGIFNNSSLYGIVVTTNSNSQGSYINALTIPYIKRDFEKDTGLDFEEYINSSYDMLKNRFNLSYRDKLKQIISEN